MGHSRYDESNRVKVSFDAAYDAPTPYQYMTAMTAVDYRVAQHMHEYLAAVVDAAATDNGPVRVLDVGCSYGVSAALLRTDGSYDDLVRFYTQEASAEYGACVEESRRWVASRATRMGVTVVGLDASKEAVSFAADARLIDTGIARNLEEPGAALSAAERRSIAECDVLFSTGVIGYITDRTLGVLLESFGSSAHGKLGPVAVVSVLELFDPDPIAETFRAHGFRFEQLPVRVPQREFADEVERRRMSDRLKDGERPMGGEDSSNLIYAGVFVAARPDRFEALTRRIAELGTAAPAASAESGRQPAR